MTMIVSQITSLTIVYLTVYSDANQRKHQSSASLAFVWGIHRDRWIPRTKGQLRGKCFHLMTSSCENKEQNINTSSTETRIFLVSTMAAWVTRSWTTMVMSLSMSSTRNSKFKVQNRLLSHNKYIYKLSKKMRKGTQSIIQPRYTRPCKHSFT